jgi:enoyl-CoA hydratase/carnithine racemase
MSLITLERQDHVAVARLHHGTINAISPQLVEELSGAIDQTAVDPEIRALVLTSANEKFFSIGFDIPVLFPMAREEFTNFYRSFNQLCFDLYTLPKPTIAAIPGHAIAGGCILALCCDYRVIAEGRKLMGLNEVKLGVPIPYVADCVLRFLVGARCARDLADGGEFYPADELLTMGMVDEVVPQGEVFTRALQKAQTLAAKPAEALACIKADRQEMTVTQITSRIDEKNEMFIDRWFAADTRPRLQEAMETFQR